MTVADRNMPALRLEVAAGCRMLLRQGNRVVLLARARYSRARVHVYRTGRYISSLPALRADHARRMPAQAVAGWAARWAHQFATWLDESPAGPLHTGSWLLHAPELPPRFLRDYLAWEHPAANLDLFGYGWNGVIPLRRLPDAGAGRVKAYRRQVAEGILPPILLWWISGLDGYLLLDGHDRLVAARAEGVEPPVLVLALGARQDEQRAWLAAATADHEEAMGHVARQIALGRPGAQRAASELTRRFGAVCARAAVDAGPTRAWPIHGGARAWTLAADTEAPGWPCE